MTKLNLGLSIAAGLLGGVLSHYMWAQPVQAQNQAPAPREVRAQSFVLVDGKGAVEGVFVYDEPNPVQRTLPGIKLYDGTGHEIWSASNNFHILQAGRSEK